MKRPLASPAHECPDDRLESARSPADDESTDESDYAMIPETFQECWILTCKFHHR